MSEAYRVLGTTFDSAAALEREWNANLAKGGVFVPGRFELLHREPVLVFVDLPFAGKALDLEGRVVHCVPPEFEERGGRVGVAVELRETPATASPVSLPSSACVSRPSRNGGGRKGGRHRARWPMCVRA